NYISRSQVRDIETGEQTLKDMEFNFIELPKFNKDLKDLKTLIEKWVYFIKNAENLELIPDNIHDEGLKSAYEEANVQTWTQEELDAYEYAFMREEDERARLDKAEQTGAEKGKEEHKIQTVLKLLGKGKSVEEISDLLDISSVEILQIIASQDNK
ncbi:MAG: transposase, partial [Bacteroidetes bacterium]